jgi:hypothetical protein
MLMEVPRFLRIGWPERYCIAGIGIPDGHHERAIGRVPQCPTQPAARIEPGVDLIHHFGGGTGQREGRGITRMVSDPRTREYMARRMKEGRTKKAAIRCLKRCIARRRLLLN